MNVLLWLVWRIELGGWFGRTVKVVSFLTSKSCVGSWKNKVSPVDDSLAMDRML